MKQRPSKVIIPVAGYGTRRLPVSKVIEKCMVPILNRPLIDYIVEDCQRADIKEIIFVVSGQAEQLKHYYAKDQELEDYLSKNNKTEILETIRNIGKGLEIHFIEQDRSSYGTAVPIWGAKDFISEEPFVVLMGDDFIIRHDGTSSVASLIETWLKSVSEHALLGVEIPKREVSRYGVLKVDNDNNLEYIVEKPSAEQAPSTTINIGRYVFDFSIFKQLESYMNIKLDGEYMLTEVVNMSIKNGEKCLVVPAHGVHLDGGSVEGWLAANNYLANQILAK